MTAGPSSVGGTPAPGIRLLADEDFDNIILRGVLRRRPGMEIVRVQDVGLAGAGDPEVLEWAATAGRVLITHDVNTMKTHAYARIAAGIPMPGVFAVAQDLPTSVAIDEIILLAECSLPGEWEGQVRHLPL
jgi:predicted nuclease of predicted toxin-antitoxin system